MKVNTTFVNPPIPIRDYDWSATFEGYEPEDLAGHGATEELAVQHLHNQLIDELFDAVCNAEKALAHIVKENPHNEAFYGDTLKALQRALDRAIEIAD